MYIDFHAPVESLNRQLSVVLRTKRCQLDLEKNKRCPFTLRPEDVEDWLALNPPCSHLNMDPSLAGVQPTIPSECAKNFPGRAFASARLGQNQSHVSVSRGSSSHRLRTTSMLR